MPVLVVKKRDIVADSGRAAKGARHVGAKEKAPAGPRPLLGARFVLGVAQASQLPADGAAEVAFAGRSNAGKSSAINALANHGKLAFASRTPGRTQQINIFALRGGGLVADLPGYGYAAVTKSLKRDWQEFLWQYLTTRQNLVALVLLVDARLGLTEQDLTVLEAFAPSGRPVLILATKADKLGTAAQREALRKIEGEVTRAFPRGAPNVRTRLFSAVTKQGVAEADAAIADWVPAPAAG